MTRPLIARLLPGENQYRFVIDGIDHLLTARGVYKGTSMELVVEHEIGCRSFFVTSGKSYELTQDGVYGPDNTPGSPDDYSGDMDDDGAVAGQGGPIDDVDADIAQDYALLRQFAADPDSPMYGSDIPPLIGDLLEEFDKYRYENADSGKPTNLTLTRRQGECIVIDNTIEVFVKETGKNTKLLIRAPKHVHIRRGELEPREGE